jgi:hypothetical protein
MAVSSIDTDRPKPAKDRITQLQAVLENDRHTSIQVQLDINKGFVHHNRSRRRAGTGKTIVVLPGLKPSSACCPVNFLPPDKENQTSKSL